LGNRNNVAKQDGGFLAPEEWSTSFIDQLYPQLALSRLPITRMNMGTRIVHLPKLTSNVSVFYSAENASITASQAQLAQLSFTARKQTFLVQMSNELIRDSNPQAEGVLRNNATRYMAIDRDKQMLIGNGQAGAPVGLLNATNVASTSVTPTNTSPIASFASAGGHAGTSPTYQDFLNAIYNVENLNGSTNVPLAQATCTGIVGPVALKPQVLAMKDSNGRPIYDYGLNYMRGSNRADGTTMLDGLWGLPAFVLTNILAGTEGSRNAFFGDWQHMISMERQDIEVVSSNVAGTAFQNDQTWVRGIARYDVGIAHPEAFYVVTNV
jgi:HK97 family phage major capsid protein